MKPFILQFRKNLMVFMASDLRLYHFPTEKKRIRHICFMTANERKKNAQQFMMLLHITGNRLTKESVTPRKWRKHMLNRELSLSGRIRIL